MVARSGNQSPCSVWSSCSPPQGVPAVQTWTCSAVFSGPESTLCYSSCPTRAGARFIWETCQSTEFLIQWAWRQSWEFTFLTSSCLGLALGHGWEHRDLASAVSFCTTFIPLWGSPVSIPPAASISSSEYPKKQLPKSNPLKQLL